MKNFFLLAAFVITQVLGDISLSRGMASFGTVNLLDFSSLIPLIFFLVTNVWILLAIFFLVSCLVLYLTAISRLDLSFVLPINACSYVINAILANWLLHEYISPLRWLSTLIIFVGVLLVGLSQQPHSQSQTFSLSNIGSPSRNPYPFFFPLGFALSKVWLVIIALSFADSAGDLFLAMGMKKIGAIRIKSWSNVWILVRKVLTNSSIWIGIFCQAIAFLLFISLVSWADISFVRPATALTYIGSMIGSKFILKEKMGKMRLIGISLIGLGVIIHQ